MKKSILFACVALGLSTACGPVGGPEDDDEAAVETGRSESPLAARRAVSAGAAAKAGAGGGGGVADDGGPVAVARDNGGGHPGAGFTCTNGVCECDKSIENDCEDMSGVCSDDTIDALITCIQGWLTTHCLCNLALTSNPYASQLSVELTQAVLVAEP